MLDLFAARGVATSVLLRGIASFGPRNIVRTDESLSLSEDLPVTIAAVDTPEVIGALIDDVVALIGRGLLTLERARLVDGEFPVVDGGDAVRMTRLRRPSAARRRRRGLMSPPARSFTVSVSRAPSSTSASTAPSGANAGARSSSAATSTSR